MLSMSCPFELDSVWPGQFDPFPPLVVRKRDLQNGSVYAATVKLAAKAIQIKGSKNIPRIHMEPWSIPLDERELEFHKGDVDSLGHGELEIGVGKMLKRDSIC